MFASAVCETINDYTVDQVISVDLRHQRPNTANLWSEIYAGKVAWQHILRLFNHTRTEYITNLSITVLYRKDHHNQNCDYAFICTELHRKHKAPQDIQFTCREIVKRLTLDSRRFTGPGSTSVER